MPAHGMRRSVVLGVGVLALSIATARADDKPKIAVLGLEVQTAGGAPDAESTKIARDLTDGLRRRALGGAGQYTMAPNSERELIDEKLMASCLDENAKCMAQIGAGLKADFLLYGRIDKGGGCDGYRVTLKLLDVAKGAEAAPPWKQCISLSTAKDNAKSWAEKSYGKVVGDDSSSTAKTDKDLKDTTTTTVVTPPSNPPKKSNGWKTTSYVTGGIAVVSGLGWAVTGTTWLVYNNSSRCKPEGQPQNKYACEHGDAIAKTATITGVTAAAAAVFTGVAIYMSKRSNEHAPTAAVSPPKRKFTVTPVVTADGGGATVQFDW